MEQPATVREKPIIIAAITALLIGVVLGVFGYTAWERLRPMPVFNFDPEETTSIRIRHPAADTAITIRDRERVEYIVGLLNDFTYQSKDEGEKLMGMGSGDYRLEVCRADGSDWLEFNTGPDQDFVRITRPGDRFLTNNYVAYITTPGYFKELLTMPSTDPGDLHEPEHPGPTAQPLQ